MAIELIFLGVYKANFYKKIVLMDGRLYKSDIENIFCTGVAWTEHIGGALPMRAASSP